MDPFIFESTIYLMVTGFVQFCAAMFAAPLVIPLMVRIRRITYPQAVRVFLAFNLFLLFWGCIGHYAFLSHTYGKMYVSVDRLVDWYPFIPFGQWVLDQGFGGEFRGKLLGTATLWDLRLLWLAFAIPVWLLSWLSTDLSFRLVSVRKRQMPASIQAGR